MSLVRAPWAPVALHQTGMREQRAGALRNEDCFVLFCDGVSISVVPKSNLLQSKAGNTAGAQARQTSRAASSPK